MKTRTLFSKSQILAGLIIFSLFIFNNSAKAQNWSTSGNSGSGLLLGTTSSDSVDLIAHDTSRIVIHSNGHIGIGTNKTGQGYLLSVNGYVRAREIVVNTDAWSDFVFDSCYVLPDLKTVEAQVKEEKHLPGVPSAAEVEANGVKVGEMNKILLQKVEELTLYLIEQQKEIDALKKQVNNR